MGHYPSIVIMSFMIQGPRALLLKRLAHQAKQSLFSEPPFFDATGSARKTLTKSNNNIVDKQTRLWWKFFVDFDFLFLSTSEIMTTNINTPPPFSLFLIESNRAACRTTFIFILMTIFISVTIHWWSALQHFGERVQIRSLCHIRWKSFDRLTLDLIPLPQIHFFSIWTGLVFNLI